MLNIAVIPTQEESADEMQNDDGTDICFSWQHRCVTHLYCIPVVSIYLSEQYNLFPSSTTKDRFQYCIL